MPRQGFATSYLQQQKNVLTAQAEIENYRLWGDMAYSILVKIKLTTYESTTSFFFFLGWVVLCYVYFVIVNKFIYIKFFAIAKASSCYGR